MTEWVHDAARSRAEARVQPRHPSAAPHWLRCEWWRGDVRCRKADGHLGDHAPGPPGPASEETGRFAVVKDGAA